MQSFLELLFSYAAIISIASCFISFLYLLLLNPCEETHDGNASLDSVEAGEDADFFSRLPDEIVILILEKVRDAHSLASFSVASKRFNSIVPQVEVVSLKITPPKTLIPRMKRFLIENAEILAGFLLALFGQHLIVILKSWPSFNQFNAIKNLEIVVAPAIHKNQKEFVKWYAVYGCGLVKLVLLSYTEVTYTGNDIDFVGEQEQAEMPNLRECIKSYLADALKRFCLVVSVVQHRPELENVVITDFENKGKLCVKGVGLFELKEFVASVGEKHVIQNCHRYMAFVKQWYMPSLRLPLTGCLMKGVTLTLLRTRDDNETGVWRIIDYSGKDAKALIGTFNGEEDGMFAEAVAEIFCSGTSIVRRWVTSRRAVNA